MTKRASKRGKTQDELFLASPTPMTAAGTTDAWRVFRIMGEFVEGFETLAEIDQAVTIFGSARVRENDGSGWYEKAVEVAHHLGQAGFAIITGGGPGIMEAANKGAREAGTQSIGLNIDLPFEQHINPYVDLSIDFRYFFVRKTMLVKYSQAFVVMPGGFGTMDELFEALTLIQTGKIHNFPVVLFGVSYWQGLLDWLQETMLSDGKISAADLDLILVTDSVEETCIHIASCVQDGRDRMQQETDAQEITRQVVERHAKKTPQDF